MTFEEIHREEAPGVGEGDVDQASLHGVAPPCDECGDQTAVDRVNGHDLCADCQSSERRS